MRPVGVSGMNNIELIKTKKWLTAEVIDDSEEVEQWAVLEAPVLIDEVIQLRLILQEILSDQHSDIRKSLADHARILLGEQE